MLRHKLHIILFLFSVICFRAAAQPVAPTLNVPATSTPNFPAVAHFPLLSNLSGVTKHNYIRTMIPDQPTDSIEGTQYYRQVTEYFDGLGRPWQTVVANGQANNYDIVQHYVYDSLGHRTFQYLPFAVAQGVNKGKFVSNVLSRIQNFYPPSHGEHPYGAVGRELTPEARPVAVYVPGTIGTGSAKRKKSATATMTSGGMRPTGLTPYIPLQAAGHGGA